MNDEFLHRIRKTPRPEFLAGLKARLDRQPLAPAPAPRRRWSFTRGLITGLLLGGAAFALTAVSLTRGPESLHSFVRATEYFARLMRGSEQEGTQDQTLDQAHGQHKAVPLGPVWLPDHAATGPSGQAPRVATQSTGYAVKQDGTSAGVNSASPASGSAGGISGGGFPLNYSIRVVASPDAYPVAAASTRLVERDGFRLLTEIDKGNGLDRLCDSQSPAPVEMMLLSRRMTPAEFRRCTRGGTRLIEIKAGYQAVALARTRQRGPMRLTARALFLALARRIPDPAHPEKLISNPNTRWSQVDSSLPAERIVVAGPDPRSPSAEVMAHLLLQVGCNSYPWIAALRDGDPDRYEEICGSLRDDDGYTHPGGWSVSEMLETNGAGVGIVSVRGVGPSDFQRAADDILLNPVNSIEPGQAGLSAETYPLAESVYLYVNKSRIFFSHAYTSVVSEILAPKSLYGAEPSAWTFVPLEATDRQIALTNATAQKELQF